MPQSQKPTNKARPGSRPAPKRGVKAAPEPRQKREDLSNQGDLSDEGEATLMDDQLAKDGMDDSTPPPAVEEWIEGEIPMEDPLEILEDPSLAVELSEDPVRLYLKEIGQINLLDADSEFRLAARIEADRLIETLKNTSTRSSKARHATSPCSSPCSTTFPPSGSG